MFLEEAKLALKIIASLCWKSKFKELVKNFSSVHFTLAFLPLDLKPSTNSMGPKALSTSPLEPREDLPLHWRTDRIKIVQR